MSEINIQMQRVRMKFPQTPIDDLESHLRTNLENDLPITAGEKVYLAVGSRGIAQLPIMVRTTVDYIKAAGGHPTIIPAMGSHGGGSSEGQRNLLEGHGISEESMGCPVNADIESECIATLKSGMPLYMAKTVHQADKLVIINRIKPHTDFKGRYASGLMKMLAIGLGKHSGAVQFHNTPFEDFPQKLEEAYGLFVDLLPKFYGVGIIENAIKQVHSCEVIDGSDFSKKEIDMLIEADSRMARLPITKADILLIEELGKEFSGSGMDPNITGRSASLWDFAEPDYLRIAVLALSEKTKGNATGIGCADLITKKLSEQFDKQYTWTNAITASNYRCAALPIYMDTEHEVMEKLVDTVYKPNPDDVTIVQIPNTSLLEEIAITTNLIDQLGKIPFELIGEPYTMSFSDDGLIEQRLRK
ncbi:MAG: DUF362 domain-containing protein [Lentisphaeria bacterium]|nr:DUF362 domain-containing protein [Lentisphaeria bacterium]NQZ67161.1 DUF362 domain-containing protein [Lentisphaeria bacterium]